MVGIAKSGPNRGKAECRYISLLGPARGRFQKPLRIGSRGMIDLCRDGISTQTGTYSATLATWSGGIQSRFLVLVLTEQHRQ